ncbi:hypothetical protein B0H14DRAFT_3162839 [Mycena olivaceomarginata]|nr:hypothetical protein B0H14DRAFT_3162839 [Mycena olivaceomarginata]
MDQSFAAHTPRASATSLAAARKNRRCRLVRGITRRCSAACWTWGWCTTFLRPTSPHTPQHDTSTKSTVRTTPIATPNNSSTSSGIALCMYLSHTPSRYWTAQPLSAFPTIVQAPHTRPLPPSGMRSCRKQYTTAVQSSQPRADWDESGSCTRANLDGGPPALARVVYRCMQTRPRYPPVRSSALHHLGDRRSAPEEDGVSEAHAAVNQSAHPRTTARTRAYRAPAAGSLLSAIASKPPNSPEFSSNRHGCQPLREPQLVSDAKESGKTDKRVRPAGFRDDQLHTIAAPFGEIASVRCFARNGPNNSSGYGFVLFKTITAAEECIVTPEAQRLASVILQALDLNFRAKIAQLEDKNSANVYIEGYLPWYWRP